MMAQKLRPICIVARYKQLVKDLFKKNVLLVAFIILRRKN